MTNIMNYNDYSARIEYDAEDEIFFGTVAGIRDRVSFHAQSVTELKAAFHEAVDDYVDACARIGKDPQRPYSGNLMLRVSPETHAKVAKAAELAGVSLNQFGARVLDAIVANGTAAMLKEDHNPYVTKSEPTGRRQRKSISTGRKDA